MSTQPKSNGYQSLHTVVLPEGRQVEIEISHSRDAPGAELGIAATGDTKKVI